MKYSLTEKAPVSTTLHMRHIAKKKRIVWDVLKPPRCDIPNIIAIIRNAIFVSCRIFHKRWLAKLLYSHSSPLSDPYFTSENHNKRERILWNISFWVLFTFMKHVLYMSVINISFLFFLFLFICFFLRFLHLHRCQHFLKKA